MNMVSLNIHNNKRFDLDAGPEGPLYVIEFTNLNTRYNVINIESRPGRTNMSGDERETGWLGTTDNMNRYAHGKFDDLQGAINKGAEVLGVAFRYIWVALRNQVHSDIQYHVDLMEWDQSDADFSRDEESREFWVDSAKGHSETIEWLKKLAVIFDVPLPSEVEDTTLQGKVLKSFAGEETVKSIATRLNEDENKIRVIVNQLIKSGEIQATGQHEKHFKKYVKV